MYFFVVSTKQIWKPNFEHTHLYYKNLFLSQRTSRITGAHAGQISAHAEQYPNFFVADKKKSSVQEADSSSKLAHNHQHLYLTLSFYNNAHPKIGIFKNIQKFYSVIYNLIKITKSMHTNQLNSILRACGATNCGYVMR